MGIRRKDLGSQVEILRKKGSLGWDSCALWARIQHISVRRKMWKIGFLGELEELSIVFNRNDGFFMFFEKLKFFLKNKKLINFFFLEKISY